MQDTPSSLIKPCNHFFFISFHVVKAGLISATFTSWLWMLRRTNIKYISMLCWLFWFLIFEFWILFIYLLFMSFIFNGESYKAKTSFSNKNPRTWTSLLLLFLQTFMSTKLSLSLVSYMFPTPFSFIFLIDTFVDQIKCLFFI
jgi:hypothetical protein